MLHPNVQSDWSKGEKYPESGNLQYSPVYLNFEKSFVLFCLFQLFDIRTITVH